LRGELTAAASVALTSPPTAATVAGGPGQPPFKNLSTYVKWVQSNHKAPFDRDGSILPAGGAAGLQKAQPQSLSHPTAPHNVKVNQDRDPWPKAEIAGAVDPTNGNNYIVMSNDFRENFDRMFYHVSTDGALTWTDDALVQGNSPGLGFVPFNFQSDPGLAFDNAGNSYSTAISGNLVFSFTGSSAFINVDTEIQLVTGTATFTTLIPTAVDDQPCNGTFPGAFLCDASLDKPLVTTDVVSGSPHLGTTYVYYTLFCNAPDSGFCTDGAATGIPAFTSAILESDSPAAGVPFSPPQKVSGDLANVQFSSLVVDSHGTPHIFFDDFTNAPTINMYESTLTSSGWVVHKNPVASFLFNGLNNPNWGFRDLGSIAPGCGIHGDTAYCAFSANQVFEGPVEGTPSVYLAAINTRTGASTTSRVNNDPLHDLKDHFFPWATATPNGDVYVGWYDNRNDPFSVKVEYFVALSRDKGKTFVKQQAISDMPSNPCTGFPGCGFFGDYVQLVAGPDGMVHAAWSDTRDGASMQIFTQALRW
jgi:hypothetical protein